MALWAAEQNKCTYCHRPGYLQMLKVGKFCAKWFYHSEKDLRGAICLKVTAARKGAEREATRGE